MSSNQKRSFGMVKYFCDIGQEKSGVDKSADILPDLLRPYLEQHDFDVHVYDSAEIKHQDSKAPSDEHAIFKANLALRQRVMKSIKANVKTLNIGGDHSMGMGTVSAFLECFAQSKKVVIWIDAHADANTREASDSDHYHGMPVAFLLGLDKDPKFPIAVPLKAEELIYVGLRDVDPFEKEQVIRALLLKVEIRIVSGQFDKLEYALSLTGHSKAQLAELVGSGKQVHISWDVDSTDPETEIACTGTPVKDGLTCEQVKAFIQAVSKHNRIVSFDITELNLDLGSNEAQHRSLNKTIDVLKTFIDC